MASAALTRTETRGAHYRQDFPKADDTDWLANLYVRRDRDRSKIEKRPVVTLTRAKRHDDERQEGSHCG